MRPEQRTTIPENPHMHILELVLFCHKHNFKVVKQQNEVHQVNLCIFHPIYILSLLNSELRLFSYEINHFNMAFSKLNASSILNILNKDENSKL